jgi:hypothetical protein
MYLTDLSPKTFQRENVETPDCGVKRRNLDQPPAFVGPGFDIEASPDKLSLEGEAKRVSCQKTRNFTDIGVMW